MARTQTELDQAAERNRENLKRAEALALALLFGRLGKISSPANARRIALVTIGDIRRLSATIGGNSTAEELNLARFRAGANLDGLRAAQTAARLEERIRAIRKTVGKDELAQALRPQLERIAATESANGFNFGRTEAAKQSGVQLWRRWDAVLDKRTCPVCSAAHGEIVRPGDAFRYGTPGQVHPLCRCTEELLRADEI